MLDHIPNLILGIIHYRYSIAGFGYILGKWSLCSTQS